MAQYRCVSVRLALFYVCVLLSALTLSGCVAPPPPVAEIPSDGLILKPVDIAALPGWDAERVADFIPAFTASCAKLLVSPADEKLGGIGEAARLGGEAGQWSAVCSGARAVKPGDEAAARSFVQTSFQAFQVSGQGGTDGLFTGYYEPQVNGARGRGGAYQTPIYGRPNDLIQADLGGFAKDLPDRRLWGRVSNGSFVPYYSRAEISSGALSGKRSELLYLADPVDAFFLEIQGSGRVTLANGTVARVSYAAQNGRPYVPVGRVLSEDGDIPADQVTMQSIRAWLDAHPDRAAEVMNQNPSYVFFRELPNINPNEGPPGALGVPLTPGRSIAVDRGFVPLGAPVWIDSTDPLDGRAFQRLMVAQDLGGAIRGAVRADVFFGWDAQAAERAGKMRQKGQDYLLLPKPP